MLDNVHQIVTGVVLLSVIGPRGQRADVTVRFKLQAAQ